MSDKTDPRLGVADGYAHALATLLMDEREFLRLLDTADRAAGIVRVDTRDEALVERLARDVWEKNRLSDDGYGPWEEAEAWDKDWGRDSVRAVLTALREES